METAQVSPQALRLIILEQSRRANIGHIGCALSVVEIISALYGQILSVDAPRDPDRDRFVLSKGHAALALYAALHLRGSLSREELDTFHADGSLLGVHPEHELGAVDFSTGSLGQGLAYGAGAALAARLQGSERRAYVLLSDGECNEGSVWESVMFASHQKLGNLISIVDLNGQQALGYTKDVCDIPDLAERWRGFGWDAHLVDGHDIAALCSAHSECLKSPDKPHVIVAKTIFGKGVSFMENLVKWHYLPMTDEQYSQAMSEVKR